MLFCMSDSSTPAENAVKEDQATAMHDASVPERLAARIQAIAEDRTSGATAILTDAVAVLRVAIADASSLPGVARALCEAQPSMAPVWNATLEAMAGAGHPGRLDRFAARVALGSAALARFAREHFLDPAAPLRMVTLSSSASVRTILEAVSADRPVRVGCAEGRPALEGRVLAATLGAAGLPVTLFSDAGLGHALAGADAVVLGADAVAPEWFINKSGTYMLAAMAARQGVPVYVAATRDRFVGHALGAQLPVQESPPEEIWDHPAPGVTVRNPYFERTPLDLITAVISDLGILGADAVSDACTVAQDDAALEALRALTEED